MIRKTQRPGNGGFTLLEAIIALFIFAVMSVMAYGGLDSMAGTGSHVVSEAKKWGELSILFNRLERDLSAVADRSTRDERDVETPALTGRADSISFTCLASPLEKATTSSIRHVGYRLHDGKIELLIWPVLDMAPGTSPDVYTLIESVDAFHFRFLDAERVWQSSWDKFSPPVAVETVVSLPSGENVKRIFTVR